MQYWLAKTEPDTFSYQDLERDGTTQWDGVRNYAARLHLMQMKKNDLVLIYHSNIGKCVVGTAIVTRENYPDPTATEGKWVAVEIRVGKAFKRTVSLEEIKAHDALQSMPIIKNSRLSVMPITEEEYNTITTLGKK